MQTRYTNYIYKNELDKPCFANDAAYSDSKDLTKRPAAEKVLRDKAFNIAKDPRYYGYQRGLASMVCKFFDKKTASLTDKSAVGSGIKSIPQNEQLAEELYKPIIKRFKRRKAHAPFIDCIWGADLADVQLLSKYNKGIRYLLCAIDIFSKYARVGALKDKRGVSIVNVFQKILKQSSRKPSKIWVDKGIEFYNSSFKKWLQDNDFAMHSTHNTCKISCSREILQDIKKQNLQIHDFYQKMCILIN